MPRTPNPLPLFLLICYGILAVMCIASIAFGAANHDSVMGVACLGAGLVGLMFGLATLPVAWLLAKGAAGASAPERRGGAGGGAASLERTLQQVAENSMLSDNAKRVLFRERELSMLRQAIEEDIARGDYNAGLTLCDEMANLFGYREEAEAYRQRIQQAGQASFESKVRAAMAEFEAVLAARDWARAHREAGRIKRLFPSHPVVQDIDQRILQTREEHKRELEASFLDAAAREDVETSMSLLRHLDRYLTREEAARLGPMAQNIVLKHREMLSVQFKQAVADHRWSEAAQIGDIIIAEYPNTKMADEVRSMIDVLRVRASQAAVMAQG
jgi:hypothetical protein